MPGWLFLISGLACGVLAWWLLTWRGRVRRGAIANGIRLSGAVLMVKPSELAGQWPNTAVLSPRLVVRYTWQGAAREGEVVLRMSQRTAAYHAGQTVDLAIDRARPDQVVLVDGGGQSASLVGCATVYTGTLAAAFAVALLIRFLMAVLA